MFIQKIYCFKGIIFINSSLKNQAAHFHSKRGVQQTRAWFNGRTEASQALDVGSIPIARLDLFPRVR